MAGDTLAQSRNIPALVLLSRLGVEYRAGIMQAAGLHTLAHQPERYGLSLAIGGAEATPMEVAQAYATLARGGRFRQATLLVESQPASSHPCIADWACWQALEACSRPERTEPLSREAARARVAWKTGTSSGYRDAWCAAVTPAMVSRRPLASRYGEAGSKRVALVGSHFGVCEVELHAGRFGGGQKRLGRFEVAEDRVGLLEVVQVRGHVLGEGANRFEAFGSVVPQFWRQAHLRRVEALFFHLGAEDGLGL